MGTLNINPVLLHKMKHSQGVHDFGFLYNWYAASNANFAPSGWHLPTKAEFYTLFAALGGTSVAGGHMKETGLVHWNTPNTGADNSSGFYALGAGIINQTGFVSRLVITVFWTSETDASAISLAYSNADVTAGTSYYFMGLSVRLIKNDSTNPGSLTDIDGNIYPTVKIGSQVWTAADWRCTKMNDGTPIPLVADQTAWNALTTKGYCIYP